MMWCAQMAKSLRFTIPPSGRRPCIVLDIDQTIVRSNGAPIRSVIRFAHTAVTEYGYTLYLITARPDFPENRRWTLDQLGKLGFQSAATAKPYHRRSIVYQRLFMMPMAIYNKQASNFSKYKFVCRTRHIPDQILINIGDQWDDLILRPPIDVSHHKVHNHLYDLEHHHKMTTRNSGVLAGVNISPCSLISVKLPN